MAGHGLLIPNEAPKSAPGPVLRGITYLFVGSLVWSILPNYASHCTAFAHAHLPPTRGARRADQLFKRGVAAYQSNEPDGVDFALGRYGAFLLGQRGSADAERVL